MCKYKCSECGKPVVIVDKEVKKECSCEAAIIASISVKVRTHGRIRKT